MIDASWLLFTAASLALIAIPGQDMILVMSRSVAQGVWLRSRPSVLTWVYRFSGAILVGLGVRLALERR